MNLIKSLTGFFQPGGVVEQKDLSDSATLIEFLGMGDANWSENNYKTLATEGYAKNPVAHRCIKIISDAIASLPWIVIDKDGNEITEGDIIDLLRSPNPEQGTSAFFYDLMMYKLIDGNTFIQKIENNGLTKELYILRPDKVTVEPGAFRLPKGYTYTNNNTLFFPMDQVTGKSQILHIHTGNPLDDWRGLSPLSVAMMSVDLFNTGVTWNQKLLQNGARPMGMFSTDQELTGAQREELKASLQQYQGAVHSGKPIVTEGGLKFQSIGLTVVDADFIEGKRSAVYDIANVFGIPPQLVGLTDTSTYNNVQEAKLELYEQIVLPEAELIKTEFNKSVMPAFGEGYTLDIKLEDISALTPRRTEKWERINNATFLSNKQKAELLGLEFDESMMESTDPVDSEDPVDAVDAVDQTDSTDDSESSK